MFGVVVLITAVAANDAAVLAMPKFAEKVASPSTATPTLIESMIAEKIIAFALDAVVLVSALNRIWTAAVLPENATVGEVPVSKNPLIEPVMSISPTARFLVALPKPVMSVDGRVKLAVHDLMIPPIEPDIEMFPPTPLIPAIAVS